MTSKDSSNRRMNIMTLGKLEERFSALCKQGKYQEADEVLKKTIALAKATFGEKHAYVTACLNNRSILSKKLEAKKKLEAAGKPKRIEKLKSAGTMEMAKKTDVSKAEEVSAVKELIDYGKVGKFAVSLVVMAVLFTTVFVYGAVNLKPGDFRQNHIVSNQNTSYPLYKVNASYSPGDRTITGEEEIFFETEGSGQTLYLNLYFNRYKDKESNQSEMRTYAYKGGSDQGYIDILSVSYKNQPLSFKEEGEILKIVLSDGMTFTGQEGLKVAFKLKIPAIADRSGSNAKGVWVGNWLPTLTAQNQVHKFTEIGDAFVNISATYQVALYVPNGYQVVLNGLEEPTAQGIGTVYQGTIEHVRDLPLFIHKGYQKITVMEGPTEICYYYYTAEAHPVEVVTMVKSALEFYNSNVGQYPWKQLNLVENDMYLSGMEYSTMLLLSTKALQNSLEETVFHEVGHQWFYNIVGSDQYEAPFIDEGLVEFFGYNVLKREVPKNSQKIWGLNQDLGKFKTWKQYRDIHYRNGRKLFEDLYVILGKTEFEKFIKEYYDKYKYTLVTREMFKAFVAEKIGPQKASELLGY